MNTVMPMYRWDTIPWQHVQRSVFKLQKRIYHKRPAKRGQEVRMTNAALLRSRMKGNLHVRF
jgi:hypothetical protein